MTDEHTGIDLQDRRQAGTDSDSRNRHRGWGQKTQGTRNRKSNLSSLLVKWHQGEMLSFLNVTPTHYYWFGIYYEYVQSVHTLHPFIFPRYYLWYHVSLEKNPHSITELFCCGPPPPFPFITFRVLSIWLSSKSLYSQGWSWTSDSPCLPTSKCKLSCPFYVVWGIGPRVLHMDEHSTYSYNLRFEGTFIDIFILLIQPLEECKDHFSFSFSLPGVILSSKWGSS